MRHLTGYSYTAEVQRNGGSLFEDAAAPQRYHFFMQELALQLNRMAKEGRFWRRLKTLQLLMPSIKHESLSCKATLIDDALCKQPYIMLSVQCQRCCNNY
jgi:hypothetical protein